MTDMLQFSVNGEVAVQQSAVERLAAEQKLLAGLASTTTPEALSAMSLHPGSLGELGEVALDPSYYDALGPDKAAAESESLSLGQSAGVSPERHIEALDAAQQGAVIAEIACYIVAMRSYKLQSLALQAAAQQRRR